MQTYSSIVMTNLILSLISIIGLYAPAGDCSAFKQLFTHTEVLAYLHPEKKGREILYLAENEYCTLNEKLGDITIVTVPKEETLKHGNRITVISVQQLDGKEVIRLAYPIEGASFVVTLAEGTITSVRVWER